MSALWKNSNSFDIFKSMVTPIMLEKELAEKVKAGAVPDVVAMTESSKFSVHVVTQTPITFTESAGSLHIIEVKNDCLKRPLQHGDVINLRSGWQAAVSVSVAAYGRPAQLCRSSIWTTCTIVQVVHMQLH